MELEAEQENQRLGDAISSMLAQTRRLVPGTRPGRPKWRYNKTESGKLVVPLTYEVSESSLSSRGSVRAW